MTTESTDAAYALHQLAANAVDLELLVDRVDVEKQNQSDEEAGRKGSDDHQRAARIAALHPQFLSTTDQKHASKPETSISKNTAVP